jgi:dihydrolipoamide dehydrogenase
MAFSQGISEMADLSFDVLVVGAGPAGYVAAIRAAQLGFVTACVDKELRFGGTCLRVGCIPSKALLDASERYFAVRNHLPGMGIRVEDASVDVPAMMARKDKVVETLTNGISFLMKKNKIEKLVGKCRFVSESVVEITEASGKTRTVTAKHIVIATGSAPAELPFLRFDGKRVISSDQAIALEKVPGSMVVIGGGAIGLELGSVWARLGAKVTVLEMLPQLVAGGGGADTEMALGLEKVLKKQGMTIYTKAKVTGAEQQGGGVTVGFEWEGKVMKESADVVLVAVGRKAYTEGLGLETIGVKVDGRGRVEVDERYRTSVKGVYAIGDVIAGPMLAHKAEEEGVACMELIAGKAGHVNYGVIPGVVYTMPELAWVGRTEEQCKSDGIAYRVGKFLFRANGRALAMDEAEGLVKVIADERTDRVLGVHILGAQASSMIAEAVAVMEFAGTAEDLGRICHAHPTLPEAVKEAALGVGKRAIHG